MTRRSPDRPGAGFTLIELLVVTLLIGIVLSFVLVNMDSMVPSARLDKGGRDLGELLNRLRGMAVFSGRSHFLEYDLDQDRYRIIRPTSLAEQNDGLEEQLESDWFGLPRRVIIEKIQFNDRDIETKGTFSVEFTPMGEVVGHYVTLLSLDIAHDTRRRLTLALNPITGLVSYDRGEKKYALVRSEFEFRR